MKKILIIAVNYNSYDVLRTYLNSLEKAALMASNCVVHVHIADTSTQKQAFETNTYTALQVTMYPMDNLGYFGGAFAVLNTLKTEEAYVVISNVDITVADDFFAQLLTIDAPQLGWIVPRETTTLGQEYNPYMLARPSRKKMNAYIWMYRWPILLRLNEALQGIRHGERNTLCDTEMNIYAGHGSMFIFTPAFVASVASWQYVPFMYGEEIFIAEEVRKAGLTTYYFPSLRIESVGSVSTSTVHSKEKNAWRIEALQYIRDKYWNK